MTKQNFLAMSLGSRMKLLREFDNKVYDLFGMSGEHTIEAVITENNIELCAILAYGDCQIDDDEKFKIILHPLSDLTKEIEHNGEKFVPIVELAKIAYLKLNWKCGIEIINGISKCYLYSDSGRKEYQFIYCKSEQSFSVISVPQNEFKYVPNQLILFQKLIEWHFDIFGLIEKGEAIDITTIENPYK